MAFLLVTMCCVNMPMFANETEIVVEQDLISESSENTVVWYKQESTQKIASRMVATAVIAYAAAVYMNKVASPVALFNALWFPKSADTQIGDTQSNNQQQDIDADNTQGTSDQSMNPENSSEQVTAAGEFTEENVIVPEHEDNILDKAFAFAWQAIENYKRDRKRMNEYYPI